MHFYKFNIGDYASHTRHLSPLEDIAYRRLLDVAYSSELPLTKDIRQLSRLINMREHQQEIEDVLKEFWVEIEEGWISNRCNIEIAKYYFAKKNHWAKKLTGAQRAEIEARRNATKLRAIPSWLTKEQKKSISNIYAQAAMITASTGIKHEVDHIVPLRSKIVCGLHVHWNLRIITATENRSKSNLLLEADCI